MQLLSINLVKRNLLLPLVLLPFIVFAQRAIPTEYGGNIKINFVRTWDAKAPESNSETLKTRNLRDAQQTTQYFDGLGRPLQTVVKQGSYPTDGTAVDMMSMVEYDAFGREAFKYLSTAANNTGGNTSISDGKFKLNPFAQQAAFYNTASASSPLAGQDEHFFYGETRFEASPLNRVAEAGAPGDNWAGTMHNNADETTHKTVKIKYYTNTATDAVRIWKVNANTPGNWGTYEVDATLGEGGVYEAGELYKAITIDERNKQVIEFKDKEGKVILKKVQSDDATADDGPGAGHATWMCTYYIYDDLGNLRCVIPPEGVKTLNTNGWVLNTSLLNHQCFRYEYDHRSRMIMKKVPGVLEADAVWMVYDARDRLVMTQDGKQRALNPKYWVVTLYDVLNRPVQTGYYSASHSTINNKTLSQLLEDAADQIDYPFAVTALPASTYYTLLTETGYDNYDAMLGAGVPPSLTKDLDNTTINGNYLHTTYNTSPLYAQQPVQSFQTEGLVTWTKVKLFGGEYFEYTVNIYDDKGRPIQVKHRNYSQSGTDITTNQYNWAGQILRSVQWYYKPGTGAHSNYVVTDMTYDDLGRLALTQKKMYNGQLTNTNIQSTPWTTIAANEYDALGQLKSKKLGKKRNNDGSYSNDPLAILDYNYNIRGWLLNINKNYIGNSDADRYFAMEIGYDKDPSMGSYPGKQHNGNISSLLWKSAGDQQQRKYNFSYDAVNRLSAATFGQYASGSGVNAVFNNAAGIDFTVNGLGYDYNGNITGMTQYGLKVNSSAPIDKMIYSYETGTNRLQKVTEDPSITPATNGQLGDFKDGSNGSAADYAYNQNGSITKDLNKGITSITYQSTLELPRLITTGKGTVEYRQDVTGNKVWKTVIDNSIVGKTITTITKYVEGFVYESKSLNPDPDNLNYSDKLQYTPHEEGRIRALYGPGSLANTLTGFAYDYFIKDHLGNVRMVLTDELKQDIYPAATLEGDPNSTSSAVFIEKEQFYGIDVNKIVDKPSGIANYVNKNGNSGAIDPPVNPNPNGSATAISQKMYKLKAANTTGGGVTGLGITLKVMGGDKIDILGRSYYEGAAPDNGSGNQNIPVLSILTGLLTGPTGSAASAAHGGVTDVTLNGISDVSDGITSAFNYQSTVTPNSSKPKAFINYIFFDEQFKAVKYGSSAVKDFSETDKLKYHDDLTNIPAPKNGYVYIYVSNQSQVEVFFDNLQVIHTRGAILEETHYYPFGLTMAGISSKSLAFGEPENKNKYNGIEHNDDFDLNMYDAFYRNLDPQTGRWWQIDPKPNYEESPYASMGNNPILHSDFLGDTLKFPGATKEFKALFNEAKSYLNKHGVGGLIKKIEKTKKGTINIVQTDKSNDYDPETNTISWNPYGGLVTKNGTVLSPSTVLNHEMDHAIEEITDQKNYDDRVLTDDRKYDNAEEARVIKGTEQTTARALGEIGKDKGKEEVTRTDHKGSNIITYGPKSTVDKITNEINKTIQKTRKENKKKQ